MTETAISLDTLNRRSRRRVFVIRLVVIVMVTIVSGFIGAIYEQVFYGGGEGASTYQGIRTGASIGLISVLIEVFYVRGARRSWLRRVAFLPGLLVRILVLTLIVRICLVGNEFLTRYLNGSPLELNLSFEKQLRDTLLSMAIVVFFVMLTQLSSVIGVKRFVNLVLGRYFRPVAEERVFLFVDLVGSSNLARRLGNVRFHQFLHEFFFHLDKAIVNTGGEVVSYVGDAVIVTWPLGDNKRKNSRCLVALRAMLHELENNRDFFEENFGQFPNFRAALHGGSVVVGECGDSRRQVTYLGDVVNLTARIEDVSKDRNEQFLISNDLARNLADVPTIRLETVGEVPLKGIDDPIGLSRIRFGV